MTDTVKKMKWIDALKKFNTDSGKPWIIPKKDTEDYIKVKKIQEDGLDKEPSTPLPNEVVEVPKKLRKKRILKKEPEVPSTSSLETGLP